MFRFLETIKTMKFIYILLWIIIFIIYFVLFINKSEDWIFKAEDLIVKTINNKADFEEKIIKKIYSKIEDSCEGNNNYNKNIVRNNWENETFSNINNIWSNDMLKWSVNWWIESIWSIWINFDWSELKEEKVKDVVFSQTNIQKQSVDEWDILKQTKDYIFYFSKTKSKIYIIKSPINWEKIDFENIEPVFTIFIPSNLTTNPELFVNGDKLVYLASKTSYNNNNTIVWIYDLSNLKNKDVKLFKIFETKWDYFKSRLIDNNLYLISDYSLNPFKNKFCNVIKNEKESWFWDFISFFTWIEFKGVWINEELYDDLKEELQSYSYKLPYKWLDAKWINEILDDFQIFYTDKDLNESINNLNFNVISVVDIAEENTKSSQSLVFWNLKNWEIHMTLDNLYLINSYYQDEKWKCDYIDICYKQFSSNNFTSISKIWYSWKKLEYLKSSIIPWKPLNQYSMDEDEWYFRIFTAHSSRNRDAALYIFDKKLKLIWEIEDIKPGEEFKSSRFIWDKAFLVTFRQRDPLFVIDLHIPSNPNIIWELHIPGYSSYLHPYWKVWNKEYLIWIGREINNTKIDLYEIDYDKKTIGNQISVIQKFKYIFQWRKSNTPAETNPRSFVWDRNEKLLYLPIKIDWEAMYDVIGCDTENWIYCDDEFKKVYNNVDFSWLKVLEIKTDSEIKEVNSYNTNTYWNINDSRVGYYKNESSKASFYVENWFMSFFWDKDEEKVIKFK